MNESAPPSVHTKDPMRMAICSPKTPAFTHTLTAGKKRPPRISPAKYRHICAVEDFDT